MANKQKLELTWKGFRPAKGPFPVYYRDGADHREYQPDFVAETDAAMPMLEPKMRRELDDPLALAKQQVALSWCANASGQVLSYGASPGRIC